MSRVLKDLKVAVITDWMVSPGGADRHLLSVLKIFPKAEVYTTIYNRENYRERFKISSNVHESFIGRSWILRKFHRHLNALTPLAFESFDLSGYDLIVSLTAGSAKGVIPDPEQTHISIILTPPRSLWDGESNIRALKLRSLYKVLTPLINSYLRVWDLTAIDRVDHVISISQFIQNKVMKTYGRVSKIVYPGIDEYWFARADEKAVSLDIKEIKGKYFLIVSRLYDYKQIDWAIKAAKKTDSKLLIVGTGPDEPYLRKLASDETRFLGWQADNTVKYLYEHAEALVFCGIEDFGYVPVEAMASACPVLAYNIGGVCETVNEHTGAFFGDIDELAELMKSHSRASYNKESLVQRAREFDENRFTKELTDFIVKKLEI